MKITRALNAKKTKAREFQTGASGIFFVAFGFLGSALAGRSPADCGASMACMTECCEDTTECCCGTDATEAPGCEEA